METILETVRAWLVDKTPVILGAIAVAFAAWIVSSWINRAVVRFLERTSFDLTLTRFFGGAARWVFLTLALIGGLSVLGVETTSFAAIIAASGLAIGLAFQGTLSNFAAGLMLLIFRPFKIGDSVHIAGEKGVVNEVALFTTRIDTFDNRRIILPNSNVFSNKIENITFHPKRRVEIPVGVDYSADVASTREALERAAASVENALEEPASQVVLTGLGASSVDWEVRVWAQTKEFLLVRQQTIAAVKRALDEASIGIPFPQMDVHLDRKQKD